MFSFILGLMILFLMIAISKAFRKKDFMHPLVMYITPFFVQYFVFYVLTDYSKVSHETMILYIGSIFMYIFGYLVTEMIEYLSEVCSILLWSCVFVFCL